MSIQAVGRVLRASVAPTHKLVLIALADHAAPDGTRSWPSVQTIAEMASVSTRTVQRILRDLEESGAIVRVADESRHRPREWRIRLDTLPQGRHDVTPNGSFRGDTAMSPLPESRGDTDDTLGVTSETLGVTLTTFRGDTAMSPEPSGTVIRTVNEPSIAATTVAAAETGRPADPIWDALTDEFGAVSNDADRARRNQACKLIRQTLTTHHIPAGQQHTAVRQLCDAYPAAMPPGSTRTPLAVASNADMLIAHIQGRNRPAATPDRHHDRWDPFAGLTEPARELPQ